jgi:hypothetical protein
MRSSMVTHTQDDRGCLATLLHNRDPCKSLADIVVQTLPKSIEQQQVSVLKTQC